MVRVMVAHGLGDCCSLLWLVVRESTGPRVPRLPIFGVVWPFIHRRRHEGYIWVYGCICVYAGSCVRMNVCVCVWCVCVVWILDCRYPRSYDCGCLPGQCLAKHRGSCCFPRTFASGHGSRKFSFYNRSCSSARTSATLSRWSRLAIRRT